MARGKEDERPLGAPEEDTITGLGMRGEGVIGSGRDARFVSGAFPGERVRHRPVLERAREPRGVLDAILEPLAARRDTPCGHDRPDGCGVCTVLGLQPEGAREFLLAEWDRALERASKGWPAFEGMLTVDEEASRRDLVRMQVDAKGRMTLPLRRLPDGRPPQGERGFAPESCVSMAPLLDEIRIALDGKLRGARSVMLRGSPRTGQRLVRIESPNMPEGFDPVPYETAIVLADGEKAMPLREHPWIEEELHGQRFRISWDARFRACGALAGVLAARLRDEVVEADPAFAVDFRAGIGLNALVALADVPRVMAAEESLGSLRDLDHNHGELREAPGFSSVRTSPSELCHDLIATHEVPDLAILDTDGVPIEDEVYERIASLGPGRLLVTWRDARAAARALRSLTGAGYGVVKLIPLAPPRGSHQIEMLAVLTRHES